MEPHQPIAFTQHDMKFQELLEEVKSEQRQPKMQKDLKNYRFLYQQILHLLEEEIPKQLMRQNKLLPNTENFV